jgi:energy-coupling factor transporter ATP-binding protein EcfA2
MINTFIQKFCKQIVHKDYQLLNAERANGEMVFKNFTLDFKKESNVLIIYGDNASGKSLICKLLEQQIRNYGATSRSACIRNRTQGGIEKAIVYGEEGSQSTGQTSFKSLKLCLKSTNNSLEEALAILDEPDIGLSPKYSKAMAEYISLHIKEFNESKYTVIVSHNHSLIQHIIFNLNNNVSSLGINTDLKLSEWMRNDNKASIEELENIYQLGFENWTAIEKVLSRKKH